MAKNLPCKARDASLIPGPGRSRVPQGKLSPRLTTPEPAPLEPERHNERSHCSERPSHGNWRGAPGSRRATGSKEDQRSQRKEKETHTTESLCGTEVNTAS